eukprot:COSAG06_NODE_5120_length_3707_cov_2.040188_4_plen_191_part_00
MYGVTGPMLAIRYGDMTAMGYGSVGGELFKLVGNQQSHGGSGQGSGRDGNGRLVFVDPSTLSIVREVEFPGTSVLRIAWHPKLNQIFVSDGEGNAHCHYTPGLSQKGALLCATKAVSKKKFSGAYTAEVQPEIINPHALPMYKTRSRRHRQPRADAVGRWRSQPTGAQSQCVVRVRSVARRLPRPLPSIL